MRGQKVIFEMRASGGLGREPLLNSTQCSYCSAGRKLGARGLRLKPEPSPEDPALEVLIDAMRSKP
jgi:hypothetical protein